MIVSSYFICSESFTHLIEIFFLNAHLHDTLVTVTQLFWFSSNFLNNVLEKLSLFNDIYDHNDLNEIVWIIFHGN